MIGDRTEGDLKILERKVEASTTRWMKVYTRDIGGVMSSSGGEIFTPVVVINRLRYVMASFSTSVDDDDDGGTSLSQIKTVRNFYVTVVT